MFVDYYSILELKSSASKQELKSAYRNQCMKWHPDKNPGLDTTKIIQDIIEAYTVLNDDEARALYDKEYNEFIYVTGINKSVDDKCKEYYDVGESPYEFNYDFSSEILEKWMKNARVQAKNNLENVIDEFKGASIEAGKTIIKIIQNYFIPMIVGYLIFKSCSSY